MISQQELASILTEHHGVPAGETEATLLAGLILDEYQRNGAGRTLLDCVEAARAGFPLWFRSTPAKSAETIAAQINRNSQEADARAAEAPLDPWRNAPVTRDAMLKAGRL